MTVFASRRVIGLAIVHFRVRQIQALNLSTTSVRIELSSNNVLIDEKVRITVKGLEQGQRITLQTRLKELEKTWGGCGHYIADGQGKVDTFSDPSFGGTFTGVEAMGLFWGVKPTLGVKPGRLYKSDVMSPFDTNVAVQEGHIDFDALDWSDNPPSLASIQLKRSYVTPGVRRIPVRENGIYGTLFIPPGEGPFPALFDLFGFIGGITEHRSALLASKGFISFTIGYANVGDLPRTDEDLDLHYFLKAFDWLAAHPEVDSNAIGGVVTCVGAGYAFFVASRRPLVRCIVTVSGLGTPIARQQSDIEGEAVRVSSFKYDRFREVDGKTYMKYMFHPSDEAWAAPGWRHGAKIFSIHGEDDQCINPEYLHRLKEVIPLEFVDNMTCIFYPGAGHLLEPPYLPMCSDSFNTVYKKQIVMGGQPKPHMEAEQNSWPKILDFLDRNLRKSSRHRK